MNVIPIMYHVHMKPFILIYYNNSFCSIIFYICFKAAFKVKQNNRSLENKTFLHL